MKNFNNKLNRIIKESIEKVLNDSEGQNVNDHEWVVNEVNLFLYNTEELIRGLEKLSKTLRRQYSKGVFDLDVLANSYVIKNIARQAFKLAGIPSRMHQPELKEVCQIAAERILSWIEEDMERESSKLDESIDRVLRKFKRGKH